MSAAERDGMAPAPAQRPGPVAALLLLLIRVYQLVLSPLLGSACRYEPSCSRYTATCIQRFGALPGVWLGLRRIGRCHPFAAGGIDPPPERSCCGRTCAEPAARLPASPPKRAPGASTAAHP